MAAFTSSANWSFPDLGLPGGWDNVREGEATSTEPRPEETPPTPSEPSDENPKSGQQQNPRRRHYPGRTCRICLEVVEPTFPTPSPALPSIFQNESAPIYSSPPGDGGRLVRPCKCKGSQQYVHTECLSAWRMQDPLRQRNYFQCPTCGYKYQLQRLAWASWISSTFAQIGLTVIIFVLAMFVLGFVADPIINLYLDPYSTIATGGGPSGSLFFDDEPTTWTEHFVKGLASLGLLGFAKFLFTLGPWHWFNTRGSGVFIGGGGGGRGIRTGTGRDRMNQLSWITIVIGIVTFLYAVWKGVRAWSRRLLERAGERVMDVDGDDDNDDDEGEQ